MRKPSLESKRGERRRYGGDMIRDEVKHTKEKKIEKKLEKGKA